MTRTPFRLLGSLLLLATLLSPLSVRATDAAPTFKGELDGVDLCNNPGVVFMGDNPCDRWGSSGSSFFFDDSGGFSTGFILLFIIVLIGSIVLRAWGFSRGREKGYGLIVSASEDPFLLNELPARPGSEAADRKVAAAEKSNRRSTKKPKRGAKRPAKTTAPRRTRS